MSQLSGETDTLVEGGSQENAEMVNWYQSHPETLKLLEERWEKKLKTRTQDVKKAIEGSRILYVLSELGLTPTQLSEALLTLTSKFLEMIKITVMESILDSAREEEDYTGSFEEHVKAIISSYKGNASILSATMVMLMAIHQSGEEALQKLPQLKQELEQERLQELQANHQM